MNELKTLFTDLYELTMVDVYRREAMADRTAIFSLFVRRLPSERGYLVAAGLDDGLSWLEQMRFEPEDLAALDQLGLFPDEFLEWLGEMRFTGSVRAVPEGTIVFAEEPILEVEAPIGQAQLAETFLLNQITLQTTLATKAARCRDAAGGRAVVDFALRRTQGIDAGMKLARICGLVGLSATSNVAGAARYGVPASGTMAHAFVQAYGNETEAFRAFAGAYADATVLVVDTYDTEQGVRNAITVAREMRERGIALRGIRLDSGDLGKLAHWARGRLDEAGLPQVKIFASGGLDEYSIHRLVEFDKAPIDGFGVGSALGVSADAPSLDSVYKLVEYDGRMVRKTSTGKAIWPGSKQVWRGNDWGDDVIALAEEPSPGPDYSPLLEPAMIKGSRVGVGERSLVENHRHFEEQWRQLLPALRRLIDPDRHPVKISDRLQQAAVRIDAGRKEG
ncbi:MAG: nicotinate phosphoribosyltransferase [Actinomycetota bacterium]